MAAVGVLLAFSVTHWFFILLGLGLLAFGSYLAWRGFGFLGDAIKRNVSYVTGQLQRRIA